MNHFPDYPLSESDRYKLILDNIHDLVCEIDEEGVYTYLNHLYEEVLGYKPEELLGKKAVELIHPDDLQESIRKHALIREKSGNSVDQWRFRDKQGNYRLIESKGAVLHYKDGSKRTVVISRDITLQKQAEQSIAESEKKYRRLHQSLMDGFAFVSMDGKILEYNEVFRQMLAYTDEELKSLTFYDITPEKWHSMESEIVREHVLKLNYSPVYQKEYRRKDGSIIPVELRSFGVRNDQDELEGMWAIVRDISERKQKELELLLLNHQLQQLNFTKDKLFSIIAHDLRSPFNTIIGYTDLLMAQLETQESEKVKDSLQRITSTARNTHLLLENLLSWAQSQTGKLTFRPNLLHLNSIVRQALATHKASARLKNLNIETDPSLNDEVYADAQMLKIILGNLISNAIEHSIPGGSILIRMQREEKQAIISISDTGTGMDKKVLDRYFGMKNSQDEPLHSGKAGLGLIICKELTERHHGSIKAESTPGKGTDIFLILPYNQPS